MSMQKPYCDYERKGGPEQLPLNKQVKFDVLIQAEVLTGCYHNCVGCFVDKNIGTETTDKILERVKELTDGITRQQLNFREFVIGPTDIFSASNIEYVLNHKTTQDILFEHTNARIANPARFDEATEEQMKKVFDILDDEDKYRREMIVELIQPLPENIDKMTDDKEYFDKVMKKLDFFKNNTPKDMGWVWTLQASSTLAKKLDKGKYNNMLNKAQEEYETILEMNPAFSRATSKKVQKKNLQDWNDFLSNVIDEDNYLKATISMANLYCNSMNFIGLTVYPGKDGEIKTILNVILHEQALFLENTNLDVTGLTFEEIILRREKLAIKGIKKFSEHPLYKDTQYVNPLAYRLVWEAIEAMGLKEDEPILPMEVLKMYNPFDMRVELFNEDAKQVLKENE